MAAPGKPKPVLPPKPPVREGKILRNICSDTLANQRFQSSISLQVGKALEETVKAGDLIDEEEVGKKADGDVSGAGHSSDGITVCAPRFESTTKPKSKPPLLPKPQPLPKLVELPAGRHSPIRKGSPVAKLFIPKPTDLNLSSDNANKGSESSSSTPLHKEKLLLNGVGTNCEPTITNSLPEFSRLQCSADKPKGSGMPLLALKAPVAKLEEFDSLYERADNPVRPPRSPKSIFMKEKPFSDVAEDKPELPLKKKQQNWSRALPCESSAPTVLQSPFEWDLIKKKSSSLGRAAELQLSKIKAKCASLGRNEAETNQCMLSGATVLACNTKRQVPVPPPRRRKRSVPDINSPVQSSQFEQALSLFSGDVQLPGNTGGAPVYARVNYNLKKNRRQAAISSTNVAESAAHTPPNSTGNSVGKGENCIVQETCVESDICDRVSSACVTEQSESKSECKEQDVTHILRDAADTCILSDNKAAHTDNAYGTQDKESVITVTEENTPVIANDGVHSKPNLVHNRSIGEQSCDNNFKKSELTIENVKDVPEAPVVTETEKCSDSCMEWSSTNALDDSLNSSRLEWESAKLSLHSSDTEGAGLAELHDVENIPYELTVNNVRDSMPNESPANTSGQNSASCIVTDEKDSLSDTVKTEDCKIQSREISLQVSENKSDLLKDVSSSKSCHFKAAAVEGVLTRTCSLPHGTRPDMKDVRRGLFRRQSWNNYTQGWPCCENGCKLSPCGKRRKQRVMSLWCDEGELSSGALADLDSSDNTAKQSSVEDVDGGGSDTDDSRAFSRGKISSWFSSFGKGKKKNKNKKYNRLSQFYCTQHVDGGLKHNLECVEQYGGMEAASCDKYDVNRPASGLSELLDGLEMDQPSDVPVSEESFHVEPHSESDNEDGGNVCCDKDEETPITVALRKAEKAFYIAKELMTSERVFIDVLKLLSVDFKKAVDSVSTEQKSPVIPEGDFNKIIGTLPQLQHLNEDLLHDLEDRIKNWHLKPKISDVIVKKGPFLKLYTTYIQNFEAQCNFLDECCQKYPRFLRVVRDFEASPRCQKLSVKHYMLKPVQRIPQYRLLLDDYMRNLEHKSLDFEDTQAALKIVYDVADHANRSIQLGDNLRKLLELQSQLEEYEIIKPGRVFLRDGELFKLSRKGIQPRYFVLLNDCLLYTSYYGSVPASGLRVNYELPLSGMKVCIPKAEDYRNEFSIISTMRSFILCARSLEERQEWVDALQQAIKEYNCRQQTFKQKNYQNRDVNKDKTSSEQFKPGKEAPVWIQDKRVTRCQSCTAHFTVTFRRHHCRACGKVVCGICSDNRAPLEYKKFQADRVCGECYDILLKEFEDPSSNIRQVLKLYQTEYDGVRESFEHTIKSQFKKMGTSNPKKVKYIPQRLKEVTANDDGSHMSGCLQRRVRRSWKPYWFVLKEQVLYVYKASEDVVALESIPVLGYLVEPMKERHFQLYEGVDAKLVFQLTHRGQDPIVFYAENEHLANRWIAALLEATVLK